MRAERKVNENKYLPIGSQHITGKFVVWYNMPFDMHMHLLMYQHS